MTGANPFLRGPSGVWPPRSFKPETLLPARVWVGAVVMLLVLDVFVRPIEPAGCTEDGLRSRERVPGVAPRPST